MPKQIKYGLIAFSLLLAAASLKAMDIDPCLAALALVVIAVFFYVKLNYF